MDVAHCYMKPFVLGVLQMAVRLRNGMEVSMMLVLRTFRRREAQ